MEGRDDSVGSYPSPAVEAGPARRPPLPAPEKLKDELIDLYLEIWLSKAEELTALEVALKVVGIDLASPTIFRTSDIQPACALPLRGGTYYLVPLDDGLEGVSAFTKYRAWRMHSCLQNGAHAALTRQTEKLLDEEITANCLGEFRNSAISLEEKLAKMKLGNKVGLCAKYRLENPKFSLQPRLNRFKIGICDINQNGKVTLAFHNLGWECTFDEMKSALDQHSRSSYLPRVALGPYIRFLEGFGQPRGGSVSFTALVAAELLAELGPIVNNEGDVQAREGDAPFAMMWESDDLLRLAYPGYSAVFENNSETSPSPSPNPRYLELIEVKTEEDIVRIRNLAKGNRKCPILVRPWQFRFFELIWRVRRIAEY